MTKAYGTPGPRALYPAMCTSPSLAACDPLAQLLFDRLLVLADDQGRVQLEPNWVKSNAVPFISDANPRRISVWIEQLARHELLVVYTSSTVLLGQFTNWWKYQAGLRRAYPSRWPAPPGWNPRPELYEGDPVYGLPRDESPGARASGARKVPADRPRNAGRESASRTGFHADSDSDSDSPPNPPRERGGRGSRSNGTNPRNLTEATERAIDVAWSKEEISTAEATRRLGRRPRQQYDWLAVTDTSEGEADETNGQLVEQEVHS